MSPLLTQFTKGKTDLHKNQRKKFSKKTLPYTPIEIGRASCGERVSSRV